MVGTVVESALENEDQNLVYTMEVENAGSTPEVIIDAGTGKVFALDVDGSDRTGDKDKEGETTKIATEDESHPGSSRGKLAQAARFEGGSK